MAKRGRPVDPNAKRNNVMLLLNDVLMYLSADILGSNIAEIDTENSMVRITIAGEGGVTYERN